MNALIQHWRSVIFRMRQFNEWTKELFTGLDFSSRVSRKEAGTESIDEAIWYESSAFVPELRKALQYCDLTKSDSIIDFGCGKGGILALMSHYPFRRIAGVEISETLLHIAKKNLDKLHLHQVELYHADATTFTELDDFNYFYFFNPFQGAIFKKVIDNIIQSVNRAPRKVRLLYFYPVCKSMIEETNFFDLEKTFVDATRSMNIYTTKNALAKAAE